MTTYKNWNNQEISFTPFYQSSLKLFRVARRVNGELDEVYEGKGYKTRKACLVACEKTFNFWSKQ